MKLLLTSAGIKNPTIHAALVELLGKPIEECKALCIPTASYGHANPRTAWRAWAFVSGNEPNTPMVELGWKSVGLLELLVLPSIPPEIWQGWIADADVLLVNGGDAVFLNHWMRESGLADFLPSLGDDTVWVGLSGGSMVMTPRIGEDFMTWQPADGSDSCLGLVDFSIFPHVDHPALPDNHMGAAEEWAAGLGNPSYAIDDETAIRVVNGKVDVISEGTWRAFS